MHVVFVKNTANWVVVQLLSPSWVRPDSNHNYFVIRVYVESVLQNGNFKIVLNCNWKNTSLLQMIHAYIPNCSLLPYIQDYDLTSVNFIHEWRDLLCIAYFEQQIFAKLYRGNFLFMLFSFLQRRCHPLTKCIKKFLTSPVIMYFLFEKDRTQILKEGMPVFTI